ncbi:MAG: hypothetical protein LBS30_01870 [Planctomycetota bacterium]|jgi:hypothetical protein|nr:hypothetical protein [Planctomycetota bacterium]
MKPTIILLRDLCDQLKKDFHGVLFREPVRGGLGETEDGKERYREPRFYIQNIGPKRVGVTPDGEEQGEDIPYILVKLLSTKTTGEEKRSYTVRVGIVFLAFDPDGNPETGSHDALNMHDRIIAALCSRRIWGMNSYIHEMPIDSAFEPGKAADVYDSRWQLNGPYYGGVILTQFYAAALPQKPPKTIVDQGEPAHPAF